MSAETLAYQATLDASNYLGTFEKMNSTANRFGIQTGTMSTQLGGLGTIMGTLANPMTAVALAAGAVGTALSGSVQAAAAWETSMSGVSKTTGISGPALQSLSRDLLTMSTNMPAAASEIANVAQVAGSLGVSADAISGFTEVAIQMGVGFEMSAEQAATSGAKILTAFNLDVTKQNMQALGNVVNSMGDNFAATESQVLDFVNRASFLNTTMGQTIPQIAALGTVMISAGMDSEVAATGLKSFLNMATSETSKKGGLDNWAKMMGTSVAELKSNLSEDFSGTLVETANKIAAMTDPVERFQAAVALAGTEGAPALLKLAGQGENLAKALGLTNEEWENGQSLLKTYEAQSSTLNSEWQMFSNTINMAAVELGTTLIPALSDALGVANDLAKVGIKVGETLSASGIGGAVKSAWDNSLPGQLLGLTGTAAGMGLDAAKDWAGIGTEHAEQMAKEISENEKLQAAAAEALETDKAKEAYERAGDKAAEDFAEAMTSAMSRQSAGVSQATAYMLSEGVKLLGGPVLSGSGKADYLSQSYEATTSVSSKTLRATFDSTQAGGTYTLWLDGQNGSVELAKENYVIGSMPNTDDAITALLAEAGISGTQGNIFELANMPEEALKWEQTIEIKLDSAWDVSDTPRNWDKWRDANTDAIENTSDEIDRALYNAANRIAETGDKTLSESLENIMEGLSSGLDTEASRAVFSRSIEDLIADGIITGSQGEAIQSAANQAGETVMSLLGVSMEDNSTDILKGVLSDPSKLGSVGNWQNFVKNIASPALTAEMKSFYDLYQTGTQENIDATLQEVAAMEQLAAVQPNLFSVNQLSALYEYQNGMITLNEMMERFTENTTEATAKTEQYKDATTFEGMSGFAAWQEGSTSGVFNQGYIGASSGPEFESYLYQKALQTQQAQSASERLNQAMSGQYSPTDAITGVSSSNNITYKFVIDETSKAKASSEMEKFYKQYESREMKIPVTIQVQVDSQQVYDAVSNALKILLANYQI